MQRVAGGEVAGGPDGKKRAIPGLDGLRGIAVLLVVAAHLGVMGSLEHAFARRGYPGLGGLFAVDAGDLGVSVFFVISGFLITTLLLKGIDRGEAGLRRFYVRRFFRIFPPYYAYLAVVAGLWAAGRAPMLRGAFWASVAYVSNYFPYPRSHPEGAGWLVGHTWSLSLEEQFYLLWPALLVWAGRRRAAWVGVGLVVAAPFLRWATLLVWPWAGFDAQVNRMFHTRIDTIMVGCCLALVASFPKILRGLEWGLRRGWTGLVGVGVLWGALRAGGSFGLSAEALALGYLVAFCVKRPGGVLDWAPLRHVGVISYGLYLWQQMFDGPVELVRHRWLGLGLIFVCAEGSYWLVEKPSYWIRDRVVGSHSSR